MSREYGQTFALADVGFFDWETWSGVDIDAGLYRYMANARPLVLAYAIGDTPARALPRPLRWEALPADIHAHHARVERGEAVWAAWNAAFDRECWNQITDFPPLEIFDVIDVMPQATAAGLPGELKFAARFAGAKTKKRESGKDLIKLFCAPDSKATFLTHPAEAAEFLLYAADDIDSMRDVFKLTLQLPIEDWEEYWTSERINLNGIAFDKQLAERAKVMAAKDKAISGGELHRLTHGAVDSVTKVQSMITWLQTVLRKDDQSYLTRQIEVIDEETGEVLKPEKLSLDRERITLLSAMLDAKEDPTPGEIAARRLLDIRKYGGSTTPAKFSRMLDMQVDGLLMGQFVFNGAAHTGRFSSRGIQLHNLVREALPYELDAIDSLLGGATPDQFALIGDDTAICRKLSMLIRPTLVPEYPENCFVYVDASQIERRITPWLASVESQLDIFREVDADPTRPDLYTRSAAAMSGISIDDVTKEIRQRGKVAELALTFCGGKGALQNMAAAYGMYLSDEDAQLMVNQWRDANPWAQDFGRHLWETMRAAFDAPGHTSTISNGKISFIFLSDYLGGSLLCQLPSGRCLTYRAMRWERTEKLNDKGEVDEVVWDLTFARGFGRIKLWPGFFVENVTQAVAADILRGTLKRVVDSPSMPMVRAHTHDEILIEVHADRAEDAAVMLVDAMESGFEWSEGLPLKAEATLAWAYSKCQAAQGLWSDEAPSQQAAE